MRTQVAGAERLIKVVKDAESAKATAKTLFESEHNVRMLLVEEAVDIDREIYLSITVDPVESKIMLIGCAEGGVEIEKVAEETPHLIHKVALDPLTGPMPYQGRELAFKLGLEGKLVQQFTKIFMGLAVRGPRQAGRRGRARPVQDLPRL